MVLKFGGNAEDFTRYYFKGVSLRMWRKQFVPQIRTDTIMPKEEDRNWTLTFQMTQNLFVVVKSIRGRK